MEAKLTRLKTGDKKYKVVIDGKEIKFGQAGASDYTKHKDPKRRQAYDARHKAREDWTDPKTAGYWAKMLLWSKPTIAEAKKEITKKKGIKFV